MSLKESLWRVYANSTKASDHAMAKGYQRAVNRHQGEISRYCGGCPFYDPVCTKKSLAVWLQVVSYRNCEDKPYGIR